MFKENTLVRDLLVAVLSVAALVFAFIAANIPLFGAKTASACELGSSESESADDLYVVGCSGIL